MTPQPNSPPVDGVQLEIAAPRGGLLARVATYAPGSVVPAALTLLTSVIFTRVFSAEAFGVYSLFLAVAVPVKLLATTWLTQSLGKFVPQQTTPAGTARVKDAVAVSVAAIVLVESVLAVAAAALGRVFLGGDRQGFLLAMLAFVVVTSAFDVVSMVFPVEHRARDYVTYKLTDSVVTFGLRLLLVSAAVGMGITLMFWSVVVSNGVLVLVMWRRAGLPAPRRLVALVRSPAPRWQAVAFLGFGLPMTLWFFSSILLDVGDRYVLGALAGPAPVGVYDANYRLVASTAALLVVPVTITMHPYLMSISGSGDSRRISEVLGTIIDNLLLVGVLAVGLTAVFHRDIADVLLGEEFRAGSGIMPVVLAGVFFFNIGTFVHKPFEIVGRTAPMVAFGVLSALVNLGLNLVLVPRAGIMGAAWATFLSYLLYTVAVGVLGRRIHPWRLDLPRTAAWAAFIVVALAALEGVRTFTGRLPYAADLGTSVLLAGLVGAWVLTGLLRGTSVTGVARGLRGGRGR
jgi:O-antigen/teichoic acid export membrane protein